ncbi:MAG: hypothetical protein ACKONH_11310, partial [Planctomycetia bacterium]
MPRKLHRKVMWRLGEDKRRQSECEGADESPRAGTSTRSCDPEKRGSGQYVTQQKANVHAAKNPEDSCQHPEQGPLQFLDGRPIVPVRGKRGPEVRDLLPQAGDELTPGPGLHGCEDMDHIA